MTVDCAAVREELAEYSVGALAAPRRRVVSEHLRGCAGCRKEAGELAEGAAVLALASPAEPPGGLEQRVVDAVAGRAARSRRRTARAALLIAAVVGVAAVGIVGAMAGRVRQAEDAAATAREHAELAAERFESVLEGVGGAGPVLSAPLAAPGSEAGGRAILYDGDEGRDFALVVIGGLPSSGEPYEAFLVSPAGRRLEVGRLRPSGSGEHSRYRFFAELSGARDLVVVDAEGRTVQRATFPGA